MKKKIVFLADSLVDLINLYENLEKKFDIIWVVYNKKVYNDLKKKDFKNLKFISLENVFFKNKNIFSLFVNFLNIHSPFSSYF